MSSFVHDFILYNYLISRFQKLLTVTKYCYTENEIFALSFTFFNACKILDYHI